LIDTIAIIGSPASRGAVASVVGAGRAGLAAASAVSAVTAAIAASAAMARLRRIASVDWAVANRFTMLCPENACPRCLG
jgi:outer membrane lipoprotein SlyB